MDLRSIAKSALSGLGINIKYLPPVIILKTSYDKKFEIEADPAVPNSKPRIGRKTTIDYFAARRDLLDHPIVKTLPASAKGDDVSKLFDHLKVQRANLVATDPETGKEIIIPSHIEIEKVTGNTERTLKKVMYGSLDCSFASRLVDPGWVLKGQQGQIHVPHTIMFDHEGKPDFAANRTPFQRVFGENEMKLLRDLYPTNEIIQFTSSPKSHVIEMPGPYTILPEARIFGERTAIRPRHDVHAKEAHEPHHN